MDPFDSPPLCKWCVESSSEVFENARLCRPCYHKAILASQNPQLCEHCSVLLTDKEVSRALFSEDGWAHGTNLKWSSENGCGLCRMFLLQDPNPDRMTFRIGLVLHAESRENGEDSAKDINSLYFSSENDIFRLTLAVSAAPDDPAASAVSQRPVETNLDQESSTRQMLEWLNECFTTHTECPPYDGQPSSHRLLLPTRVIDVGTELEPISRLFQPQPTLHAHYITLSYCWGRQPFLTTVSSNIDSHLQKLEDSKLPQTFRDAIKVTRKLGFRYLWIDALCIIQDSMDDKTKEIGAMENVYSNSALTIAVVSASSVAEGFLQTKDRLRVEIPYRCPAGSLGSVQVSPQERINLWQESLYTRAWCLQENLLSSRLLLFTNTEVIWQCQSRPMRRPSTTHVAYEHTESHLMSSPFGRLPTSISSTMSKDSQSSLEPALDLIRYNTWTFLVENYTRRNLTVPSDRLPAIAGIAKKFKDSWNYEYCAGIWKQQFIPSLTWHRNLYAERHHWPRLSQYRAPSWSWASVDGPIEFDRRFDLGNMRGLGAKLISYKVVPLRHQAPLGEVESAKAVIEASLIPARDVPIRGLDGMDEKLYFIGGFLALDNHIEGTWPKFAGLHILDDELKKNAWAMLLGEGKANLDGPGKMTKSTALILMPVDGEVDTFRRVGFWESSVKASSKLWVGAKHRKTITIV